MSRLLSCVLCLLLCLTPLALAERAGPELPWPDELTSAQAELRELITRVNTSLMGNHQEPFNSLFECYPGIAVLGITAEPMAEVPEDVELTATFLGSHVSKLELRVGNLRRYGYDRFWTLAGTLIWAAENGSTDLEAASATPKAIAEKAAAAPDNSFGDTVIEEPGEIMHAYYTYSPGMYQGDADNSLTLTLVIPYTGLGGVAVTPLPQETDQKWTGNADYAEGYEGYYQDEKYQQYDVYISPTPEPVIEY